MDEVLTSEFPFVKAIPKKEKSRLRKAWDLFNEFSALWDKHDGLAPAPMVAKVLDVSRQRVDELMREGVLERIQFNGHNYVTKGSLVAYANTERRAGRPIKADTMTNGDAWKISKHLLKGQ